MCIRDRPKPARWTAVVLACLLSACASTPRARTTAAVPAFTIRTTPPGASVETTQGYRCTTPCQVALGPQAFAVTVSALGYKPVQIPVAAGQDPGTVTITMVPQDPGAAAPVPVGSAPSR